MAATVTRALAAATGASLLWLLYGRKRAQQDVSSDAVLLAPLPEPSPLPAAPAPGLNPPAAPLSASPASTPAGGLDQDSGDYPSRAAVDELLLPGGALPREASGRFALCVSRRALEGWVQQPSPCCAAASMAGALNALARFHHGERACCAAVVDA
jgi:hypothetical protein